MQAVERYGKYEVKHILDLARQCYDRKGNKRGDVAIDDIFIPVKSLLFYFKKGTICSACGLKGKFFTLEYHEGAFQWHFALYGEKEGVPVLFTKDHIKPRSLGGKATLANLQPMCKPCNQAKGNTYEKCL